MPYISASGEISGSQTQQPWSVAKVVSIFWGILNFVYMLFATLISPGSHARGDRYTQDYRSPGGGGPPRPPRRNVGGLGKISTLEPPPCGGGG